MKPFLMLLIALAWLVSAAATSIYLAGLRGIGLSVRSLRDPRFLIGLDSRDRVAIVVPARNEAARIGRLVRSITSAGPHVSSAVIVDDESSDGTINEVLRAAGGDPRVAVLRIAGRPQGWAPKAFAVQQGALSAGDARALLFLDADVAGDVSSLASMASHVMDGELMAFEPRFTCRTAFCRMSQPMLNALLHGFFGFHRALDRKNRHSLIYGCCWSLTPYTFWEAGGMAGVRDSLLEDRTLAVRLKSMGVRLIPVDAREVISVESWGSPRELINLLRRISYHTTRRLNALTYVGLSAGVALLFLWPFAAIPLLALRAWLAAAGPLLTYAAQVAFTAAGAREARIPAAWALAAPLSGAIIAYGIISSRWASIEWKGRKILAQSLSS